METKTKKFIARSVGKKRAQKSKKRIPRGWRVVQVKPGIIKSGNIKTVEGSCYGIAATKMNRNYGYVEGVIVSKETEEVIPHAWNIDKNGRHVDFTMNPQKFIYIGIEIPAQLVWKTAMNSGYGWFSVLPHINENELGCSI